jgi:IclR family transcriptional regulator, KDG regulon repressor
MPNEYTVPAVQRAVEVLELLAVSHTGISLADLSRQTGYPKSSLFRILLTLEKASIVQLDRTRSIFTLGMKLIDWGNRALEKIDLKSVTHPHLVRMAHETRESYYVAILDDNEVIIIDRADTPEIWRVVARLGQRSPVHATASGQVLMAEAPDEMLHTAIQRTGLKRFTPQTITGMARLKIRLKEIRKDGYVINDAEYKPDLCVISVPLRDHHGKVVAALMTALTSERSRKNKPLLMSIVELLKREAAVISKELGYQGPQP